MSKFKKFLIASLAIEGIFHFVEVLISVFGLKGYSFSIGSYMLGQIALCLNLIAGLYFGIICIIASKYLGKHHHNH